MLPQCIMTCLLLQPLIGCKPCCLCLLQSPLVLWSSCLLALMAWFHASTLMARLAGSHEICMLASAQQDCIVFVPIKPTVPLQVLPALWTPKGGSGQSVGPGQQPESRWALTTPVQHLHTHLHTRHLIVLPVGYALAAADCPAVSAVHSWQANPQQQHGPSLHCTVSRGVFWCTMHEPLSHPGVRMLILPLLYNSMACPNLSLPQASWTAWRSTRQWTSSVLHSRARRSPGESVYRSIAASSDAFGSWSVGLRCMGWCVIRWEWLESCWALEVSDVLGWLWSGWL